MKRAMFGLAVFVVLGASTPSPAQVVSAPVKWEDWKLTWEVRENTGVAIRDVFYKDKLVLAKGSLPVIRVEYDKGFSWYKPWTWGPREKTGRCGPFQDRIKLKHIKPISDCGTGSVCVTTYTSAGVKWLEIGGYARIGEYHIYQGWYLSNDGRIQPFVQSRGLSCRTTHRHHPYWRLDVTFQPDEKNRKEQVFVYDQDGEDKGWGAGWRKYTNEVNDEKNSATKRVWFIRDAETGDGVWVIPGRTSASPPDGADRDGRHDGFAKIDVGVRKHNILEDKPWEFGACGQLGYGDNDSVQEHDVVFWYVAHLPHEAGQGPAAWLTIGPTLVIHRQPPS
jgi:hypothetical protein